MMDAEDFKDVDEDFKYIDILVDAYIKKRYQRRSRRESLLSALKVLLQGLFNFLAEFLQFLLLVIFAMLVAGAVNYLAGGVGADSESLRDIVFLGVLCVLYQVVREVLVKEKRAEKRNKAARNEAIAALLAARQVEKREKAMDYDTLQDLSSHIIPSASTSSLRCRPSLAGQSLLQPADGHLRRKTLKETCSNY